MKLDPETIERLKQKIAVYREFLKNWLEPSNLAQLRDVGRNKPARR